MTKCRDARDTAAKRGPHASLANEALLAQPPGYSLLARRLEMLP
jgi:hypothetical protein